jgi:hypothetical protein
VLGLHRHASFDDPWVCGSDLETGAGKWGQRSR